MNKKLRIALVEYLNTLPYQWAFSRISSIIPIDLHLVNPAECATLLHNDTVDLALIPVGALGDFNDPQVVTDFGISCDGEVKTVCLFSQEPLENVEVVYLDSHSRTSQKLALIYLREELGLDPEVRVVHLSGLSEEVPPHSAVLMIGDKVFENESRYAYKYDLGEAWKKMTGLPFVFAVWVTKGSNHLDSKTLRFLNLEFAKVINNIESILKEKVKKKEIDSELVRYFRKNIQYNLGKDKRMSIKLFLSKVKKIRKQQTKKLP